MQKNQTAREWSEKVLSHRWKSYARKSWIYEKGYSKRIKDFISQWKDTESKSEMDKLDMKNVKITHKGVLQHNADGTTEIQKITQAGLVARSPEGTAAKGMNIRGNEDLWVEIQANTFKNWVNEHLRDTGMRVSVYCK